MSHTLTLPLPGGRCLRLTGHTVDEKRSPGEYAEAVRRAISHGYPTPRRERMPAARWYVYAAYKGSGGTSEEEQWLGTVLKGFYRLGWSRYRFKWVGAELAVGGEDSMVQASVESPLATATIGVHVPRRWLHSWVYERRSLIRVRFGYIGSIAHVMLWHDERLSSTGMESYYREKLARGETVHVDERQLWNGWQGYVGGAQIVDRKLLGWPFGQKVYTEIKGEPETVTFTMPEGDGPYTATVTPTLSTWKRPRAWWSEQRQGTLLEIADPPMFAGKGTESYNLDDDGYYSQSGPAKTVTEAVRAYIAGVSEQRRRYGMPAKKTAS